MLRVKQAEQAWEGRDIPSHKQSVYVVSSGSQPDVDNSVAPNTKSVYEFVAMVELRQALRLAPALDPTQRLLDTEWTTPPAAELHATMPMETPSVGDLLGVMEFTQYEAHSHGLLGNLYLKRGMVVKGYEHLRMAHPGLEMDVRAQ